MARNGLFDLPEFEDVEAFADRLRAEFHVPPIVKMELAVTEACNLACQYCFCHANSSKNFHAPQTMSLDTAKAAIDLLIQESADIPELEIVLFGGEPLLNKACIYSIVEYSQAQGVRHGKKIHYTITTNGTLLDDEMAAFLKTYNAGIMVSLDGPAEIHDKQCPAKSGMGSHHFVLAGLNRLMVTGNRFDLRGTLTHPLNSIPELLEFYEKFPCRRIVLEPGKNAPEYESAVDFIHEDYIDFSRQLRCLLPDYIAQMKQKKYPRFFPHRKYYENIKQEQVRFQSSTCGAGLFNIHVTAQGDLYPCARFAGISAWNIGNLSSGVNREKAKEIWINYWTAISGTCRKCWCFPVCAPAEPCDILLEDGTFSSEHRSCEVRQSLIEDSAYLYCAKMKLDHGRMS